MFSNAEQLKSFVRKNLGCSCSDDVFNSIEHDENVDFKDDLKIDHVFTIGNRLLIFILMNTDSSQIETQIEPLITIGKARRDNCGLNRFRLVLVAKEPQVLQETITPIFDRITIVDEKIHLHVLDAKLLEKK